MKKYTTFYDLTLNQIYELFREQDNVFISDELDIIVSDHGVRIRGENIGTTQRNGYRYFSIANSHPDFEKSAHVNLDLLLRVLRQRDTLDEYYRSQEFYRIGMRTNGGSIASYFVDIYDEVDDVYHYDVDRNAAAETIVNCRPYYLWMMDTYRLRCNGYWVREAGRDVPFRPDNHEEPGHDILDVGVYLILPKSEIGKERPAVYTATGVEGICAVVESVGIPPEGKGFDYYDRISEDLIVNGGITDIPGFIIRRISSIDGVDIRTAEFAYVD